MKNIKRNISLSLVAIGLMGGVVEVAQAANPILPNPILVCVYTSSNINPLITSLLPSFKAVLKASGYQWTWSPNPAMPFKGATPAPGQRVCSAQYAGFNPNPSLGLNWNPSLALSYLNPSCEKRMLVTTASQIGAGQEYAVHYSITKVDLDGVNGYVGPSALVSCVVSNVDVDS